MFETITQKLRNIRHIQALIILKRFEENFNLGKF